MDVHKIIMVNIQSNGENYKNYENISKIAQISRIIKLCKLPENDQLGREKEASRMMRKGMVRIGLQKIQEFEGLDP